MSIDILDQPHGGILEVITEYVMLNPKISEEKLIETIALTDEGKDYIDANCLPLLKTAGLLSEANGKLQLNECTILDNNVPLLGFSTAFKIQLLNKIMNAEEKVIGYFEDILRTLFEMIIFDDEDLETIIRNSRSNYGISVSDKEELRGKIKFCKQFLRYLNFLVPLKGMGQINLGRTFLKGIIRISLDSLENPTVSIYSDLMKLIDREYLPVLHREEDRLLILIQEAIEHYKIHEAFEFTKLPDGGRILMLAGEEFNAIVKG